MFYNLFILVNLVYIMYNDRLGLANRETATPEGRVLDSTQEEYIRPDIATWFDMSLFWFEKKGFIVKDL